MVEYIRVQEPSVKDAACVTNPAWHLDYLLGYEGRVVVGS